MNLKVIIFTCLLFFSPMLNFVDELGS